MIKKQNNIKNWEQFIIEKNDVESSEIVDNITSKLDEMGIKYELSGNKFKPFKVIHKPINKSDEFYKQFDDIIYTNNLESVVKVS